MRTGIVVLLGAWVAGCSRGPAAPAVRAPVPDVAVLQREVERLAPLAGGTVGVSLIHVESGQRVALRAEERFPLASAYKVPIAVTLLRRVERGQDRLEDTVVVRRIDLRPGSGVLLTRVGPKGETLTVGQLLELMMTESDNTATDLVLGRVGGPGAVTAQMRELGIGGVSVDRSTAQLIADSVGIAVLPPDGAVTLPLFRKLQAGVPKEARTEAAARLEQDPRDTGTPDAMAALLLSVLRSNALTPELSAHLLGVMRRNHTGWGRLKGLLPPGTEVASKTGTIGRTVNDVGVVTLPEGKGHVIAVVLVKQADGEYHRRERAIAEIARAGHDFFLFQER